MRQAQNYVFSIIYKMQYFSFIEKNNMVYFIKNVI